MHTSTDVNIQQLSDIKYFVFNLPEVVLSTVALLKNYILIPFHAGSGWPFGLKEHSIKVIGLISASVQRKLEIIHIKLMMVRK